MLVMLILVCHEDDVAAGKSTCGEGYYIIHDNGTIHCVECPDWPAGVCNDDVLHEDVLHEDRHVTKGAGM